MPKIGIARCAWAQAVAQVELMTGYPGPVEAMRAALVAAVAARQN